MTKNEMPCAEGVREFQPKVKLRRSAAKPREISMPVVSMRDLH